MRAIRWCADLEDFLPPKQAEEAFRWVWRALHCHPARAVQARHQQCLFAGEGQPSPGGCIPRSHLRSTLCRYIDIDGNGRISAGEVRDSVLKIYQVRAVGAGVGASSSCKRWGCKGWRGR